MYDIIGDVHGNYRLLKKLLLKLGYSKTERGFAHENRKAIFVGDFINRGPEIRKTLKHVRLMVENGNAFAVLGNHEVNAIIYHLKNKNGEPLIKQPRKYFLSLYKTINQFAAYPEEWKGHLRWLRTLPFALELDGIRVVHACWADDAIKGLQDLYVDGRIKRSTFRKINNHPESELAKNVWLVTKGVNMKMPVDLKVINNKGVSVRSIRMRWWEYPENKTFGQMSFESKCEFPPYTIPSQILPKTYPYAENNPLIFFGHYCRFNGPNIISPNICCVDSCVAGSGTLTAYCWSGEGSLDAQNLVSVRQK